VRDGKIVPNKARHRSAQVHQQEEACRQLPECVGGLLDNPAALPKFYDSPAEHWVQIRSTNPIESLVATVRHPQRQNKLNGARAATLAIAFKLRMVAAQNCKRPRGHVHLPKRFAGVRVIDVVAGGTPNPLENVA
jgi:putative transposase